LSVYEYCMNEANRNTELARTAPTKELHASFMGDAVIWESRALNLSVEDAGKDIDEVILWRIFEKKREVKS